MGSYSESPCLAHTLGLVGESHNTHYCAFAATHCQPHLQLYHIAIPTRNGSSVEGATQTHTYIHTYAQHHTQRAVSQHHVKTEDEGDKMGQGTCVRLRSCARVCVCACWQGVVGGREEWGKGVCINVQKQQSRRREMTCVNTQTQTQSALETERHECMANREKKTNCQRGLWPRQTGPSVSSIHPTHTPTHSYPLAQGKERAGVYKFGTRSGTKGKCIITHILLSQRFVWVAAIHLCGGSISRSLQPKYVLAL